MRFLPTSNPPPRKLGFCLQLLIPEVHLRYVMDLLGHSEISLTMNPYSHVISAARKEIAARMDEILIPVADNQQKESPTRREVVDLKLVGARGFEHPTPWSRTRCSTRLSHAPTRVSVVTRRQGG